MMSIFKTHSSLYHGVILVIILMFCFTIGTTRSDDSPDIVSSVSSSSSCVCGTITDRPNLWDKVATARWMVHNIDWGVLTTISSRRRTTTKSSSSSSNSVSVPIPFGNIYSFVDGSCSKSTGVPYFYGTYMDQTLQDMIHNPIASFTLSEASIDTSCMSSSSSKNSRNPIHQACRIIPDSYTTTKSHHHHHPDTKVMSSGDPESPICARLTLTGILEVVPMYSTEYNTTLHDGFYQRHPQMSYWPTDHNWIIFKLNITQYDLWLINYFGGATIITPDEYFKYNDVTTSNTIAANDPVN